MSYEDNILLRIRRQFTPDEKLKFVLKKLSEAQQEIGVLKSELSEAQDKITELNASLAKLASDKESIRVQNKNTINRLREETRMLIFWRDKYYNLKAKQDDGSK